MNDVADCSFSVGEPGELNMADFGSHVFVYDKRTGETHFLSLLPAEILTRLSLTPDTLNDLAAKIAADYNHPLSADWQNNVKKAVSGLLQLDLIQPQ